MQQLNSSFLLSWGLCLLRIYSPSHYCEDDPNMRPGRGWLFRIPQWLTWFHNDWLGSNNYLTLAELYSLASQATIWAYVFSVPLPATWLVRLWGMWSISGQCVAFLCFLWVIFIVSHSEVDRFPTHLYESISLALSNGGSSFPPFSCHPPIFSSPSSGGAPQSIHQHQPAHAHQ